MEVALVSVATGVLKPVLGKLATLLGDEYKRFKDVRKDIKLLTHELAAMDAFLLKMSEVEDPDVQDKVWMNAVRELSYDMEDSIDDFMQSVDDKDAKPDGFIEKIKHSLGKMGKMKTHRRIASEIQELKKQIIAVGDTNARYKGRHTFSITKNEIVDPRILARFKHASKLVGIDETKAEIIKLLAKEDGQAPSHQQPKIVSIVGFGGMGKTTLANQVYQDLKGEFQCQAFVSVSRNPDMMNILRTILTEITGISYADTEAGGIEQLIKKINDFLEDKRYFIVIDDIWDIKDWEVIRCALADNQYDNRVITTTRDHDVAHKVGGAYELKPLPSDTSKILFYGRLFGINNECPNDLVEVSETILKKCGGVPLAIITIAGLLASKEENKREWNKLCDSIGSGLDNSPDVKTMRKILALGYHHLPIHLKACLLYLSIFPEDYIILGDRLIWRWICEGFLHGVQEENLFELGESCLTELINRGLIQHVDSNTYGWTADGCRVHDLVLDLISSICIEKNFCTVLYDKKATSTAITSKVRRLFLQLQDTEMPQARMILSHVRSLTVFGSRDCVEKMPPLSFFPRLRVLDLEDYVLQDQCHTLEHLGSLCQLRYLDLGSAYLDEFLLEIHIGQLKNLICLQAGFYCKITFRPGVIRKLEALQVLSSISLSKSPHIAKELRHLIKLRVLAFSLEGIPDESLKGWILESLCHLENLQSLFVHVHYNLGGACLDFLGEGWIPPPRNLRRFLSPFGTFSYLPSWISPSNLRELSIIEIGLGHLRQEDLDILGSFPSLQSLQLSYYKNIWDEERKQWPVVSADTFPCLRECGLGLLPKGGNMFAPGAMPNVHILRFHCQIDDVSSLG